MVLYDAVQDKHPAEPAFVDAARQLGSLPQKVEEIITGSKVLGGHGNIGDVAVNIKVGKAKIGGASS